MLKTQKGAIKQTQLLIISVGTVLTVLSSLLLLTQRAPLPKAGPPDRFLEGKLDHLDKGEVAYSMPTSMMTGESEIVKALVSRKVLTDDVVYKVLGVQPSNVTSLPALAFLRMTVSLTSTDFNVTSLGSENQLVPLEAPAMWEWSISPKQSGNLHLHMVAKVNLGSESGDYTTIDREISVQVDHAYEVKNFLQNNWKWTIATLGAMLAFLIRQFWSKKDEKSEVNASKGAASITGGAITSSGTNVGHQLAGNAGPIHIGDIHNGPAEPLVSARDYSADWRTLAGEMRAECGYLRADWQNNNILGERWDVKGGDNRRVCQTYLRRAGKMLLKSPAVRRDLPDSVLNDPDDMHRWLRFLKERYQFEHGHIFTGTTDDGGRERIVTGTVPDLSEQSFKACIDCSNTEL